MLFGNVLNWQVDNLARQRPALPATDGFVRRVKPLVGLGERETAAYCALRRIDYILDECPIAAGNRHLRYKDLLNELEEDAPGAKAAFLPAVPGPDAAAARLGRRGGPGRRRSLCPLRVAVHERGLRVLRLVERAGASAGAERPAGTLTG